MTVILTIKSGTLFLKYISDFYFDRVIVYDGKSFVRFRHGPNIKLNIVPKTFPLGYPSEVG